MPRLAVFVALAVVGSTSAQVPSPWFPNYTVSNGNQMLKSYYNRTSGSMMCHNSTMMSLKGRPM